MSIQTRPLNQFNVGEITPQDSNTGFIALGATRQQVSSELAKFSKNQEYRKQLVTEIFESFFVYVRRHHVDYGVSAHGPKFNSTISKIDQGMEELSVFLENIVEHFLDYAPAVELRSICANLKTILSEDLEPSVEEIKRQLPYVIQSLQKFEQFREWLSENRLKHPRYEDASLKLKKRLDKLQASMNKAKNFCATSRSYKHYVKKLTDSFIQHPLGVQSAILFAKSSDIDLHIWERSLDDPENLMEIASHTPHQPVHAIHMLKIDNYVHFKLLSIRENQPLELEPVPIPSSSALVIFSPNPSVSFTPNERLEIYSKPAEIKYTAHLLQYIEELFVDKRITSFEYQSMLYQITRLEEYLSLQMCSQKEKLMDEIQEYLRAAYTEGRYSEAGIRIVGSSFTSHLSSSSTSQPSSSSSGNEIPPSSITSFMSALSSSVSELYYQEGSNDEILHHLTSEYIWSKTHHITIAQKRQIQLKIEKTANKIISLGSDIKHIEQFTNLWLKLASLYDQKQLKKICSNLFRLLTNNNAIPALRQLTRRLISESVLNQTAYYVLEIFLSDLGFIKFLQTESFDDVFLASLNSPEMWQQDPFYHYSLYAKMLLETMSLDKERLANFFDQLKFKKSSHELAIALFRLFVDEQIDPIKSKIFFEALIQSHQLSPFKNAETVVDPIKTLQVLDGLFHKACGWDMVSEVIRAESPFLPRESFPIHTFLSPMFLASSQLIQPVNDPLTWHRALYHFGNSIQIDEQIELCRSIRKQGSSRRFPSILKKLMGVFNSAHTYYNSISGHRLECAHVYSVLVSSMLRAVKLTTDKSLDYVVEMLEKIVKHFSLNKKFLKIVLNHKEQLGEYANGLQAVQEIFTEITQEEYPPEWATDQVADKFFILYCHVKYPVSEFHRWFQSANRGNKKTIDYARARLPSSDWQLSQVLSTIHGLDFLPKLGIKVLLNSQVFAIKAAADLAREKGAVFFKIETGQGKSVVSALTALHYALNHPDKKIYIFTVYDHLAQRDYEKFQPLFEHYRIKSGLVSEGRNNLGGAQIIYSEMKTFFGAMRTQAAAKMKNESAMGECDLSEPGIVILDEFDSIILDSSAFDNTVEKIQGFLGSTHFSRVELSSVDNFMQALAERCQLGPYLASLSHHNLTSLVTEWLTNQRESPRKEGKDALGHKVSYVGGGKTELMAGNFYSRVIYFKFFAFLKQCPIVIGLSGTIDQKLCDKFKPLFPNFNYLEIPRFSGNSRSGVIEYPSPHRIPRRLSEWCQSIYESLDQAIKRNQPILIFADDTESKEWAEIKEIVNDLSEAHDYNQFLISEERDITKEMLSQCTRKGSITIATDIASRGTDFKLSDETLENCPLGLHVLLTYYPKNKNGERDDLKITQIRGRTGRLDQPGSFQIIARREPPVGEQKNVDIPETDERFHALSQCIDERMKSLSYSKPVWKAWVLFNTFIHEAKTYPEELRVKGTVEKQAQFVVDYLFRGKVPDPLEQQQMAGTSGEASTSQSSFFACLGRRS